MTILSHFMLSRVCVYKIPFFHSSGLHPTFEQMQVLVSRNKARPLLEGNLVDRPGVRLIRETMEDCWDADAEARLTALCIEERLSELQSHRGNTSIVTIQTGLRKLLVKSNSLSTVNKVNGYCHCSKSATFPFPITISLNKKK